MPGSLTIALDFLTLFALLHLSNSLLGMRPSVIALRPGHTGHAQTSWLPFEWRDTRWHLLWWPPTRAVTLTAPLPVALLPEGLQLTDRAPLIPWSEVVPRQDGHCVHLGDGAAIVCPDHEAAAALANLLRQLRHTGDGYRARRIAEVLQRQMPPIASVEHRVREWQASTRSLRSAALLLAIALFVGVPGVLSRHELHGAGWPLGLVLAGAWGTANVCYRRAARTLFGPAWPERVRRYATAMCIDVTAPLQAAARLLEPLGRGDPAVLRVALARPDHRATAAAQVWRQCLHPTIDERRWAESFRRMRRDALRTWLTREGFDPDHLAAPPVAPAKGAHRYCPRCHSQYRDRDTGQDCSDCPGVPCRPFSSARSAATVPLTDAC